MRMRGFAVLVVALLLSFPSFAAENKVPPILRHIQDGDLKAVSEWIDAGGNVNEYYKDAVMKIRALPVPLHVAVVKDKTDIVRLLLEKGADPNFTVPDNDPPLKRAYYGGNVEIVKMLLAAGAKSDPRDLGAAAFGAYAGNIRVLAFFLTESGYTDEQLKPGMQNALWRFFIADLSKYGDEEVLSTFRLLLSHGADVFKVKMWPDEEKSVLEHCIERKYLALVKELVSLGFDPKQKSSYGCNMINRSLVEINPSNSSRLPPCNLGLVDFLIEKGVDPAEYSEYCAPPVLLAAGTGCEPVFQRLLDLGVDPDSGGRGGEALLGAYKAGSEAIIETLVKRGIDPKPVDRDGKNRLYYAASGANWKIVERLLDEGDPPNLAAAGYGGMTPLLAALEAADPNRTGAKDKSRTEDVAKTVLALLDHGAVWVKENISPPSEKQQTNYYNPLARTLLHQAVEKDNLPLVRELLKRGYDVNKTDSTGSTPLMMAVLTKDVELIDFLLASGADPKLRNKQGEYAFSVTRRSDSSPAMLKKLIVAAGLDAKTDKDYAEHLTWLLKETVSNPGYSPEVFDYLTVLVEAGARTKDIGDPTPVLGSVSRKVENRRSSRFNAGLAEFFLSLGADVNGAGGKPPLLTAAENNDAPAVRWLMEKGAKVNVEYQGSSPVSAAAGQKSSELLKILLKAGAKPGLSNPCRNPLRNAANGAPENTLLLLEAGVDPNLVCGEKVGSSVDRVPVIFDYLLHENFVGMKMLLDHGADPNALDDSGFTPISRIRDGKAYAMKLLLDAGADPNKPLRGGTWAPLCGVINASNRTSSSTFDYPLAKMLLSHGADPNKLCTTTDELPDQVINTAAKYGQAEIVELLLSYGAKVDNATLAAAEYSGKYKIVSAVKKALGVKDEIKEAPVVKDPVEKKPAAKPAVELPVTNITFRQRGKHHIEWKPDARIEKYRVYKSDLDKDDYVLVAETDLSGIAADFAPMQLYKVRVTGVTGEVESAPGNAICVAEPQRLARGVEWDHRKEIEDSRKEADNEEQFIRMLVQMPFGCNGVGKNLTLKKPFGKNTLYFQIYDSGPVHGAYPDYYLFSNGDITYADDRTKVRAYVEEFDNLPFNKSPKELARDFLEGRKLIDALSDIDGYEKSPMLPDLARQVVPYGKVSEAGGSEVFVQCTWEKIGGLVKKFHFKYSNGKLADIKEEAIASGVGDWERPQYRY